MNCEKSGNYFNINDVQLHVLSKSKLKFGHADTYLILFILVLTAVMFVTVWKLI